MRRWRPWAGLKLVGQVPVCCVRASLVLIVVLLIEFLDSVVNLLCAHACSFSETEGSALDFSEEFLLFGLWAAHERADCGPGVGELLGGQGGFLEGSLDADGDEFVAETLEEGAEDGDSCIGAAVETEVELLVFE